MYICICNNVTDKDIAKAVETGCHSLEALQKRTQLGTQCGSCKEDACALLKRLKANSMPISVFPTGSCEQFLKSSSAS